MFRAYLVDDEPLVLEELASNPLIAECGYQVVGSSSDTFKAVKEIKTLSPDVVLTDLRMPDCSGVDMIEKLRKSGAACEFIIISAFPEFEEQRRFFLLGGFDYLLKPVSEINLQQLLNRLTGKLVDKKMKGLDKTPSPKLNEIIEYLKENIAKAHSLESVCEKFQMNRSYFSQLFANHLGTTFTAYMTKLRMEEAANLLANTQKSVKEIAEMCGYGDYFYFCRVFRKYHLCTPTMLRESAK